MLYFLRIPSLKCVEDDVNHIEQDLGGYRKKFELVVTLEEVQLMLAPWLNVSTIVEVDSQGWFNGE